MSNQNESKPDIEYHHNSDGLFTTFLPATKAGEAVWNEIAALTENTGKFFRVEADSVIQRLINAGYTVRMMEKPVPPSTEELDTLFAELDDSQNDQSTTSSAFSPGRPRP